MKELNKFQIIFVIIIHTVIFAPSPVSAEWAKCDGMQIWTGGESLNGHGLKIYYSAAKYLLFLDATNGSTKFCQDIGPGWQIAGFSSFPSGPHSSQQTIVLQMRNGMDVRYYNVENGQRAFLHSLENTHVYVDAIQEKNPGTPVEIIQEWSGNVTKIRAMEFHRIIRQAEWAELWERHMGEGVVVPPVDFTAHMIVGILSGKKINSAGVKAVEVRELGDVIYFDYDNEIYKPKGRVDMMVSFGFFVVPRLDKKIILRENLQNSVADLLPVWKVVKEFAALK